MQIGRIDHFVLTVADPDVTCEFYEKVLGMESVTFADGRRALHFRGQKINLHQAGREFEPKASRPAPGSADFCLITHATLDEVIRQLSSNGVQVLQGPVAKEGALGMMESVYFRDPDGNLVEVSVYPG